MDKIQEVQQYLQQANLDGWLLYYFDHNNPHALEFLGIDKKIHISRRFFYWIPVKGEPIKIVHKIEPYVLDHMPGTKETYQRWQELEAALGKTLKDASIIAMEYSKKNALPYVSKIDAGTIEMIEEFEVEVVSSASFLQRFTCTMTKEQQEGQKEAGQFLDQVANQAFAFLKESLQEEKSISEYELQKYVLKIYSNKGFMTDFPPTCAFGVHTADPHYSPTQKDSTNLKPNQLILLDFTAKKKEQGSVYGDITRMGFSGIEIPLEYQKAFDLVKKAQDTAFDFINQRFASKKIVKGYEVDQVCRKVIEQEGMGEYFTHRTGHNIYQTVHGPGAHLDSFETQDERPIISRTCFTIEPGLYFPNRFGVRVEYDVFVHDDNHLEITSGEQKEIYLFRK